MSLREELAALCHEQWSGWMEYLLSEMAKQAIVSERAVKRWMRQMKTPYKDLSEKEKESDRKEADRFIEILNRELSKGQQAKQELLEEVKDIIKAIELRDFTNASLMSQQLIAKHTEKDRRK